MSPQLQLCLQGLASENGRQPPSPQEPKAERRALASLLPKVTIGLHTGIVLQH